jgi:hypothetical protein
MSEHHEALGLEQSCVRPGHWLIEGYDVTREHPVLGTWVVSRFGQPVAFRRTLDGARIWIADQVNGGVR